MDDPVPDEHAPRTSNASNRTAVRQVMDFLLFQVPR